MKSYVVVAPEYTSKSAGISALHTLNAHLNKQGCVSRIISIPPGHGKIDISKINDKHPTDEEIVIYPDCYSGNPFKAKNVIRYLLMFAGYFGPDTDSAFPDTEYLYYYCPEFVLNGVNQDNILTMPVVDETRFTYSGPEGREGSCFLAIKYHNFFKLPLFNLPKGCVEISHLTDLPELFKKVKKLYTYDNFAINLEAMLSGVDVEIRFNPKFTKFFDFGGYFDYKKPIESYAEQKRLYREEQLPSFIARTQERFK